LQKAGLETDRNKLTLVLQAAGDRIKVAGDIVDYAAFFQGDDQFAYDEAAFEKRIRKPPEAAGLLRKFADRLGTVEPFDAATLEKALQDFAQAEGIRPDQIIHALRVAVTGRAVGFGLFESLAICGQSACAARIERALEFLK
jgi:glutamyl-tRNA synthetase